jgi:hypothetical protein
MSLGDRSKPERIEGETEEGGKKTANIWRQLSCSEEKHKKSRNGSQSLQPSKTRYDSSQSKFYKNVRSILFCNDVIFSD